MGFSKRTGQICCVAALGVALAISLARRADAMEKSVESGYLGIMFHDVTDSEVVTLRLKNRHGAEIVMVDHDGPAGKAGLREHDVVLSMNGTVVDGEEQLRRMLHEMQPGRSVSFVVCHDGVERTVNATLEVRAAVERQAKESRWIGPPPVVVDEPYTPPAPPPAKGFGHSFLPEHILPVSPAYTGATVDAMGPQLADFFGVKDGKGLLVHDVEANSPAAAAGLRAGDVVTRVNNMRVGTEKDWTHALRETKGREVSLTVIRDRREQTMTMVPDSKKRSAVDAPVMQNEGPSTELRPLVM